MTTQPATDHLLLVSLGPIQDFIASARRCQDLWFGSWMLSDLSRIVASHLSDKSDAAVIFPAGLAAADLAERPGPGVANLILSQLPAGRDPEAAVANARHALQSRLQEIAALSWKHVPARHFAEKVAREQLAELMEVQWAAVPDTGDYAADRRRVYARLAAVKNTRGWIQPSWGDSWGSGKPKSSLDGERESVIHEDVYPQRGRDGGMSALQRRRAFGLKGMERLCGVGLLKRLGADVDDAQGRFHGRPGRPAFHSTSHMAMVPVLDRLQRLEGGGELSHTYLEALASQGLPLDRFRVAEGGPPTLNGYDGVLLLQSRLRDHFEQECEGFLDASRGAQEETLKAVATALRALLSSAGVVGEPCPYYAFLLADGDNMGQAIDAIGTAEGHRQLGVALNGFAAACSDIVRAHQGSPVFSGGDDVLALLPLHTALACARALAERFREVDAVVATLTGDRHDRPRASLSVGLGISHCRESMTDARALARRAEAIAKANPGKDALGVVVSKRSGGDLELCGGWREVAPLDERIEGWMPLLDEGSLSAKTAHDLEKVAAHYESLPVTEQRRRVSEIVALAGQVIGRKRRRGGGDAEQGTHDRLLSHLEEAATRPSGSAPASLVRALSAELQVARLLWQARRNAVANADLEESSP